MYILLVKMRVYLSDLLFITKDNIKCILNRLKPPKILL